MLSKDDKDWLENKCGKVDRPLLYAMLIIILISSFDNFESVIIKIINNMKPPITMEIK